MINLVLLLAAAALVCLQCGSTNAQLKSKMDLDNSLSNVIPKPKKLSKYVNITKPPVQSAQLSPGQELEISCEAMGNPIPHLQWLKNGQLYQDYELETNELLREYENLGSVRSILLIQGGASSRPEDLYTCLATSGVKRVTASTTVFNLPVEDETLLSLEKLLLPSQPHIVYFYNDVLQEMGTNLILPCRVISEDKTELYWLDNQDKLIYGNPRHQLLPNGDLLINNLNWDDMGEFTCTTKNAFGIDSVKTFIYPLKAH